MVTSRSSLVFLLSVFNLRGPGRSWGNRLLEMDRLWTLTLAWNIPIGHQRILLAPEHDSDVCSMLPGGIEVCVVTCRESHESLSEPDASRQGRDGPKDWARETRQRKPERQFLYILFCRVVGRGHERTPTSAPSQSSAGNAHKLASLENNCF